MKRKITSVLRKLFVISFTLLYSLYPIILESENLIGLVSASETFNIVANPTPPPANTQEAVVDNGEPEFSVSGSGNGLSVGACAAAGYLGDNHYGNSSSTSLFTWTFDNLPQDGEYVVEAHWVGHSNRTENAQYSVTHDGGTAVVGVNQRTGAAVCESSGFQALGTFTFTAGNTYTVTLPASTDGAVSADAIKFILVEEEPTVTSVTSTSADGIYMETEVVNLVVDFSELVNVSGTPELLLNNGAVAQYASGSGTSQLLFTYTVSIGDDIATLDYDSTASLQLNGGSIQDISTNDANLTLPAVGTFPTLHDISIDTVAPNLDVTSPIDGAYVNTDIVEIRGSVTDDNPYRYYYLIRDEALASIASATLYSGTSFTDQLFYTLDATARPDGTYNVRLRARDIDNAGHASEINTTFVIDRVAPVITFTDDVEAGPVGVDDITIEVTDLNLDPTTYFYGFSADAVCDGTDTYSNAFVSGTPFSISDESENGNYVCAVAEDLAGNVSYLGSANPLNIDDTPPTIQAVSAVTTYVGTYVRGNNFAIRMNATDLNGIALCEYSVDGGATWGAGVYNTAPANDRCEATGLTAADGEVLTITMRATDTHGNQSVGASIIRIADSVRPTVTAFTISPLESGHTNANPILSFTIEDSVSPINRCQYRFRITGSGAAGWSAWTNGTLIGSGTSVDCVESISGLSDGVMYDFQVRGRDSVNRESLNSSINGITVDAFMTSTLFTSPTDGSFWNTTIDLDGISTDNVAVAYVELYYSMDNGSTWNSIATLNNAGNDNPFMWEYDWTPALEGEYDLRAIGFDSVGNQLSDDVVNVTYDITPPAVPNPISPTDGIAIQGVAFNQTWDTIADADLYRYQSCHVDPGDIGAVCTDVRFEQTYVSPSKFVAAGQPNGQLWWRVQAGDAAGNWSEYGESFELIIDNDEPVITLDVHIPDPTSSTTLNYTGNTADVYIAGIESVEYMVEDSMGNVIVAWSMANPTDGSFDSVNEDFDFGFSVAYDDTYTVSVRSTDRAGNVSTVITDDVTVDTTNPEANDLEDMVFNEGDPMFTGIVIVATDVNDVVEMCIVGLGCFAEFGAVDNEWDISQLLIDNGITHFDTSIIEEGSYTLEYYVVDAAGNESEVYSVTYTVVNVPPVVVLGSNQTINEGASATFTASFTDPSTVDIGDDIFDDASWVARVDYGEGAGFELLGSYSDAGTISIPSHQYLNNGVYTVTVEVCEADPADVTSSEGECSTASVTVTVNNLVPTVVITTNPGDTSVNQSIVMSAVASLGNAPYTYTWGNGNFAGCTGSGLSVSTPSVAGTYTCEVSVMDVDGDVVTASRTVVVTEPEVVEETPTPTPTPTPVPTPLPTSNQVLGTNTTDTTGTGTANEESEEEEEESDEDSGDVLGSQTCNETQSVKGLVYFDKNGDGVKNDDEDGIADIKISIFFMNEDEKRTFLRSDETDSNGEYEFELCPGEYEVEVDSEDLEDGKVLSANVKDIKVEVDKDMAGLDFNVVDAADDSEESGFNWWYVAIPLGLLILLLFVYLARRGSDTKLRM